MEKECKDHDGRKSTGDEYPRTDNTKNNGKEEDEERHEHGEKDAHLKREPPIEAYESFVPEKQTRQEQYKNRTSGKSGAPAVERQVAAEKSSEGELRDDRDQGCYFQNPRRAKSS